MSVNPIAYKDGRQVTLDEVERHSKGLTCPSCERKLVVKDGRGHFVARESPRNRAKGKHFAHIANSGCHGEGPVHYRVKKSLCEAINSALKMPREERNFHGRISYLCPDPAYGPKDTFKHAPGSGYLHQEFEQMQHGYHEYDLLHCSARPTWTALSWTTLNVRSGLTGGGLERTSQVLIKTGMFYGLLRFSAAD